MEGDRQLFLIMSSNNKNHYSLHRISEPRDASDVGDETTIRSLEEPLFEMHKSIFSDLVSFAAIDSRVFIVGGCSYDDKNKLRASKKVFIYDTKSSKLVQGPSLNYGKIAPHLFTLRSKLFALTHLLYSDDRKSSSKKRKILFEVLDTSNVEAGWSPLPIPTLHVSKNIPKLKYNVEALVAMYLDSGSCSDGVIFLSVEKAGTYIFDIGKQIWEFASDDALPFSEHGSPIPHAPSLCSGISIKSGVFCVFRFCYKSDKMNQGLQIHETKIDDPYSLSPPLPPFIFPQPLDMVQGPGGRFYFVDSGVDRPDVANTVVGNRYVKVSAYEFSNLGLDEEKRQPLKRCKTKNWPVRHKEVETQFKLTGLWRMSFFGGPVCDPLTHVEYAFAI